MKTEFRWVVLEVHWTPWEAHITRALLASEGIRVNLASAHFVGVYAGCGVPRYSPDERFRVGLHAAGCMPSAARCAPA